MSVQSFEDPIQLTCNVTKEPNTYVTWKKDFTETIVNVTGQSVVIADDWKTRVVSVSGGNISLVNVENGTYTCETKSNMTNIWLIVHESKS